MQSDPSVHRHLNKSTPFSLNEYNAVWKNPNYIPWNFTEYRDFQVCDECYNLLVQG